ATGEPLSPVFGLGGAVQTVSFGPDDRRGVTASGDGTVRIWDAARGRPLTPPVRARGPLTVLPPARFVFFGDPERAVDSDAFSADGRRVVTASGDGKARIWDMAPDDRPAEDLVALAQLLSGHWIDEGGGVVPLPADELGRLWADLRARYPADFAVTPAQARAWRGREIRGCLREGDGDAAEIHHLRLEAQVRPGPGPPPPRGRGARGPAPGRWQVAR